MTYPLNNLPKALLLLFLAFALTSCGSKSEETSNDEEEVSETSDADDGEEKMASTNADEDVPESFGDPIDFNDYIIEQQTKIMRLVLELSNSDAMATDMKKARKMLAKIDEQTHRSIDNLNAVEPYEGGEDLLKAAKDLFRFYGEDMIDSYKELMDIAEKGRENITDADIESIDQIVAEITEKEKGLDNAFASAQQAFARQHGFRIQRSELQDEIDQMGN